MRSRAAVLSAFGMLAGALAVCALVFKFRKPLFLGLAIVLCWGVLLAPKGQHMKSPQNEPYQRSRHRAALHAWVVAATTVASIGMPSVALARGNDEQRMTAQAADTHTPAQAAQRVAKHWLEMLKRGDVASALHVMRLPRESDNEKDVVDEAAALSDWLRESDAAIEPLAAQQAGHWALTAWRLGDASLIEPITLYHPASDEFELGIGGSISAADWQVVPQGMQDDPALAPLYNADHASLMDWYQKTV